MEASRARDVCALTIEERALVSPAFMRATGYLHQATCTLPKAFDAVNRAVLGHNDRMALIA
jgi:hypothetical protein